MESIREVGLIKNWHMILDSDGFAGKKYWLVAIKCKVGAVESRGIGGSEGSQDEKHINRGSC